MENADRTESERLGCLKYKTRDYYYCIINCIVIGRWKTYWILPMQFFFVSFLSASGAMRSTSAWTRPVHWVSCLRPVCVIEDGHKGSGAAWWLPWEPLNIPRQIPEMAIKRNFTLTLLFCKLQLDLDSLYGFIAWCRLNSILLYCLGAVLLMKYPPGITVLFYGEIETYHFHVLISPNYMHMMCFKIRL